MVSFLRRSELFACGGQRWLCPCRACPAQVAGVGTGAEPAAESQHRKTPVSSAFWWDFPFEIQPLTLSAPVLFLGFPRGLAISISPGITRSHNTWTTNIRFVVLGQVSRCPSSGCAGPQLVGGGCVCTTKVFAGEDFYAKLCLYRDTNYSGRKKKKKKLPAWQSKSGTAEWARYTGKHTCMYQNILAAELNLRGLACW